MKVMPEAIQKIVFTTTQKKLNKVNYYYHQGVIKIQLNVSIWKNKIFQKLEIYYISGISGMPCINSLFKIIFK